MGRLPIIGVWQRFGPKQRKPTVFFEDKVSFRGELDAHISSFEPVLIAATSTVAGSEDRAQQVFDEFDALDEFVKQVSRHIDRSTFPKLPRVTDGKRNVIEHVHKLVVPPWQGNFLVSSDGSQVIGLTFSRIDQDFRAKLSDALARHMGTGTKP